MSNISNQQLHTLIELIPDEDKPTIFNVLSHFVPDDVASPEDLADIKQARDEYARGEFTKLEDII